MVILGEHISDVTLFLNIPTDYNIIAAVVFNPYYSLGDIYNNITSDYSVYLEFLGSKEFEKFSLLGKTDYKVPFYNINGDRDYQTNFSLAQKYFDEINAPYKQMFIMKDTTHGLLESKSEEFSDILLRLLKIDIFNSHIFQCILAFDAEKSRILSLHISVIHA